jgi:hypothetical protein
MEVKKGRVYICTKTIVGWDKESIYYKEGNIYFSEEDDCITNEFDFEDEIIGTKDYLVPARIPEPGVLYKVINSNFLIGKSGLREGNLIRFREGDDIDVNPVYFYDCYEAQREPMEVIRNKRSRCIPDIPNKEDKVNSPKHYTSHPSGIECIEITKHYDFCIGNAIKYLWRSGLKKEEGYSNLDKEIEDLEKAIWYINDKIKTLKNDKESRRHNS